MKSVPTYFLIAFGLTVALLKRKHEKAKASLQGPIALEAKAGRVSLFAVVHPASALFVTQTWSKAVDYSNIPVTGFDNVATGIALNLGETKQTQFLRALGFPIGAGGILIFPYAQGNKPPPNPPPRIILGVTDYTVTLSDGRRIVPKYNLADPFEGRKYYTLDPSILPPDARGPLSSKLGDEYSLAYFAGPNGLVDAFGRAYPPGDYDWSTPWLSQLGHNLANGMSYAVDRLGHVYQDLENIRQVFAAITSSPLWQDLQTGFAYIPGWGTAVSAGMAIAASYGRGESLADMGLAAARGAVPSAAQPAFDVAVAVARGSDLDDAAIEAFKKRYIPAEYQPAFDQGVQKARSL